MPEGNEFHLHIHEGATPETVRAAVLAYRSGTDDGGERGTTGRAMSGSAVALARRAYIESDGQMCPLLEYLAEHPDRLVPYTEASEALGFPSARSMPGLLGAFGRRANHRYNGEWPFEKTRSGGAWHMRMSAEVAETIRALADAQ